MIFPMPKSVRERHLCSMFQVVWSDFLVALSDKVEKLCYQCKYKKDYHPDETAKDVCYEEFSDVKTVLEAHAIEFHVIWY